MRNSTAKRLAVAIVTAATIVVAVFSMSRLLRHREPHVEVDRALYPVMGIDISAHNGLIDFDSVAAADIDFVYIKASEGDTFRDIAFPYNLLHARDAGLAVGAYHFFRFDCDGRTQAENLLSAIDRINLDLPIAIDIEEWGNPADIETELIVSRLETMQAILEAQNFRVIFYTNKNGYTRFFKRLSSPNAQLWICSFTNPPIAAEWRFWQHSHIGRIPGASTVVDLNTFNGSEADFQNWIAQ